MPENGRVALITGGSRGIGKAIALELASRGLRVVVNYRSSSEAADEVVKNISDLGGEAMAGRADVSDPDQVKELFKTISKEFGPVEILVNNAGITRDGLLMRMKESDWDAVIDGNLKSAYLCSKDGVKVMAKGRWGRIVNIASVVGLIGNPGQANYCASKAGIIGLTKSIAREYAQRGITVNAVAPGFIATDMTDILPESVKDEMLKSVPAGRAGTVEDVAKAVAFLVSEDASYINGQVIAVDGGMTMV
ncbi:MULTISPECIES: 3-oxoacyl-[acyl-carrier-protein] reductase [Dethiosulfovibrio]|jgi:3-oxoacyl-[acyl-carrier protein] reductase|uniref:3-oxoacyl-[acyl-carrier-protein] reductase n=2 Tax=Dethiosulfovibrio TaxID=47054 RepID=A0ABS9EL86_9BACT|nr:MULTISPECIES: 3-oxoacyl-[acyl-carrier-protein] reductase [Dethiosulfovibrio]MCF4113497.1 3-oxoacyl-[acyl-carrier-protein] reductase [Dethiosulfovibrio russensis]MCF4141967.1 3-oxoacyl-[acyl-carrier-protein] reductase [Dethiosulfovibrio marinus]MCF4144122.1 3-oxoacyl-[acyl-carrier-protein] reductase [Dethiosulfovibrio acidaminovorans]MEA3284232.1 3-oxoacyl-[acyl-carrier-protein] reductase [Synergistota bacterium]